jgi:hypothetical protein
MESDVLIEAQNPYATTARGLLTAADLNPVIHSVYDQQIRNILHQIQLPHRELAASRPIEKVAHWICGEMDKTVSRHHDRYVVFCLPQMPGKRFVKVCANVWSTRGIRHDFDFANTVSDAVARFIQRKQARVESKAAPSFALDAVPGMDALTTDLRDDASGRVSAEKIVDLFGINLATLSRAAGISKQGLAQKPDSVKAQGILRLFERIARLRSHPQFKEPAALKKWFRKPLPIFSNHSAEELFEAGKLDVVAEKVDQMLTGDFGG